MKSILVIGMGRFGRHLATRLQQLGNDVMIVDKNERIINELEPNFTNAFIGDCTNEAVVKRLGINNFDICLVTIGGNFQSSLEITSLLKELGAKHVISKADRDMQAKFLSRNGADEVIYLERDMAEKLAIRYNFNNIFDYIELGDDTAIVETPILIEWIGKTIAEVNVRKTYQLNILAIKNNLTILPAPTADYVFRENDHIMVIGTTHNIMKLTNANPIKKAKSIKLNSNL